MGKLIRFWQKDTLNKLIALVVLVIILAVGTQVYLLLATPGGKTFLASFIPTPTPSVDEIFKLGAETSTAEVLLTSSALIPTITTMPFTPMASLLTPTLTPTPANLLSGPTDPASTLVPATAPAPSSTPTRKPTSPTGKCLPAKDAQAGKVVDVVDGNTVRVLIGDLVYVVRYIGVNVPQDPAYAQVSAATNAQLVYAKEIKLYAEGTDKDESNRLLRYVVVADSTLVNQELIRRGLATADTSTYACSSDFTAAEQDARTDRAGMWKTIQPQTTP
jgi:endonuclease YncB( thermonuclease family)